MGSWWRGPVVVVCLVLSAVLAPLALVATWAHDEVSDTDRYVETVAPLAKDPAVQSAVSDRITEELLSRLDVRAVTDEAVDALAAQGLNGRVTTSLKSLGTPLANAIESFVGTQVQRVIESDAFTDAWVEVNREAHGQMVAVLTGETGGAVEVEGAAVKLNLAALIEGVKQRLIDAGFALAERIPEVQATFTLFESADLAKAQTLFRVLDGLARALPIAALILFVAAVLVSRRRRRTLVAGSLVIAGSMLLLGLALNAFRVVYLDAIPTDQLPADAAGVIYDQLVHFIRLNLRAVLVLFLAIAAVAWVSGPDTGSGVRTPGRDSCLRRRQAWFRSRRARNRTGRGVPRSLPRTDPRTGGRPGGRGVRAHRPPDRRQHHQAPGGRGTRAGHHRGARSRARSGQGRRYRLRCDGLRGTRRSAGPDRDRDRDAHREREPRRPDAEVVQSVFGRNGTALGDGEDSPPSGEVRVPPTGSG